MLGYMKHWFDSMDVTGNDRELLRAICEHASGDFGMCIASQKRLAWDIGDVRRQTVNASLARLVDGGYVEKVGVTHNETLQLRPCTDRAADRSPIPPDPCPESGQPLFPTNPDGSAILTPVRKADTSEKRTRIREIVKKTKSISGEEEKEEQPNTQLTRARKNLTKLQADFEFVEEFWPAYPRKVSKANAQRAFAAARRRATLDEILAGLGRSIKSWEQTGRIKNGKPTTFVPHPSTWLNGDCWEDDLDLADDRPGMESVKGSTDSGQTKGEKWSGGKS